MPGEDITALYGKLQEEVGRSAGTADRLLVRRPGVKGALAYSVKKLLRFLPGDEQRATRPTRSVRARGPRGTVAYYSPMPPKRSGIADYSALLLPALSALAHAGNRYRIRQVFGSRRHGGGDHLGTGVAALIVFDNGEPVDVYPHQIGDGYETIRVYLTGL